MIRRICVTAVVGLAFTAAICFDDDGRAIPVRSVQAGQGNQKDWKPSDVNVWMKAKQKHAQEIFSGLTEGDFAKIEQGASVLYGTGVIEKWLGDREFREHYAYEGQVNAFEYSLKELVRHSRQKDIDGALNAYVMMSQTCVRCHRLIRDAETVN